MAKRVRRPSQGKTLRVVSKGDHSPETKLTICLTLLCATFLLTSVLLLWVRAAVRQGPDAVTLQLGPAEPCLSAGLDADIKTEAVESLRRDSEYFIPAYTFLFMTLGLVVFCATGAAWRWSLVIMLLALLAARCDFLENRYLDACLDGEQSAARLASTWSCWKWALLGLTLAAAAPLFLQREDRTRNIGLVLIASGVIGLLVFIPTGREELVVRYLFSPTFAVGLLLVAGSCLADVVSPHQRAAHWQERGRKASPPKTARPRGKRTERAIEQTGGS
ncbi:MAG TPA: hypothetical protein VNN62_14430 [Methylomirabilota bacterium]|jgi:hypothetical protein|nr:hypothetical protein [Methylomirabilota bacterium]